MFAGVGPYSLTIAKKHPKTEIINIEINPFAVTYANKNVELNKITNIKNFNNDV